MILSEAQNVIVCPKCKGKLILNKTTYEFICKHDMLAFPIRNDIPVMIESQARVIIESELAELI